MSKIYISIVIPVYNEEKRITQTLNDVSSYLDQAGYSYEIIVIDDGSTDRTFPILLSLKNDLPQLYVAKTITNRGKGYAVRLGMGLTEGKYRLFMDADHSVNISFLEIFLQEIKNGFDIVIATIFHNDSKIFSPVPEYKKILGKFSRFIVKKTILPDISDTQRGFKLFRKEAAEKIFPYLKSKRFVFDIELLAIAKKQDLKIREVPVSWDNSPESKVAFKDYLIAFWEFVKILV